MELAGETILYLISVSAKLHFIAFSDQEDPARECEVVLVAGDDDDIRCLL
ncbi:hypothetical protein ADIS_0800 [Lunatimonas lonarensis]|uniref:Uncharacterized protein n=1 Tax=Lunatimonas lonarensis TaxID=1232681 RepID=R7ZY09_9BACT|nr:hypothetical protein ADIS_0800 [Lunatimonas lonarensis]